MPTLSHGEKMALYLLLSSGSKLRLDLDGKAHQDRPPQPFGQATDLSQALYDLVRGRGWKDTNQVLIADKLNRAAIEQYLWDPLTGLARTSATAIMQAVQMDIDTGRTGKYDPNNPCPVGQDETYVFNALAPIPPPMYAASERKPEGA
jgi:hypothetical protein